MPSDVPLSLPHPYYHTLDLWSLCSSSSLFPSLITSLDQDLLGSSFVRQLPHFMFLPWFQQAQCLHFMDFHRLLCCCVAVITSTRIKMWRWLMRIKQSITTRRSSRQLTQVSQGSFHSSLKMSVILKCATHELKAHLFFLIVALRPKTCMTDGGKHRKQRYWQTSEDSTVRKRKTEISTAAHFFTGHTFI